MFDTLNSNDTFVLIFNIRFVQIIRWCVPTDKEADGTLRTRHSVQFVIHQECADITKECGLMFHQAAQQYRGGEAPVVIEQHFFKIIYAVASFFGVVPKVDLEPQYMWWSDSDSNFGLEYFKLQFNVRPERRSLRGGSVDGKRNRGVDEIDDNFVVESATGSYANQSTPYHTDGKIQAWQQDAAHTSLARTFDSASVRQLGGILDQHPYGDAAGSPKDSAGPFHLYVAIRIESSRITLPIDQERLRDAVDWADTSIIDYETKLSDGTDVYQPGIPYAFSGVFKFQNYPEMWNPWYEPSEVFPSCPWSGELQAYIKRWIGICDPDANFLDCATVRAYEGASIYNLGCSMCTSGDVCLAEHTVKQQSTGMTISEPEKYFVSGTTGIRMGSESGILRYEGEDPNFPFIQWAPKQCRWCPVEAYTPPDPVRENNLI